MGREHRSFPYLGAGQTAENLLDPSASSPLLPPRPAPAGGREQPNRANPGMISLRPIKGLIQTLGQDHPIRIVLLGEPDEMPRWEYEAKVMGWIRLLYGVKL